MSMIFFLNQLFIGGKVIYRHLSSVFHSCVWHYEPMIFTNSQREKKTTKKQKIRTIANQRRILCATNYQQNNDMTTVRRMHNESGWRWEAVVKLLPFLFFEISHSPKYDSPSIRKTKQIQLNEDIFCDTYANCAAIHLVLNSQLVSNGSMSMNHIIMAYLLLST